MLMSHGFCRLYFLCRTSIILCEVVLINTNVTITFIISCIYFILCYIVSILLILRYHSYFVCLGYYSRMLG
jgi:hypothetical protein